mgnify:CR=1 FL=1|tara:strand:- start:4199 stop:4960 length:762 start_codon:yes stop_codon:yes gene_type:complete
MLDQSVFKKFDLLPMSYSKLNSFSNFPCQFIINKIYKQDTGINPAMRVGHLVEEMLHEKLLGKEPDQALYQNKLEDELFDYHDQENLNKYINYIPQFYKQCLPLFQKLGNYKLHSYQEEIKTNILGIDFIGYTDFIFDLDDCLFIYDLKTKARMAINHSEYLQQWVYRKALQEKYKKPVHCHLYIVTPKKYHIEDIEFDDDIEIEIHNKLKGMTSLLQKCNTPEDIALLYQPNLDSWEWNVQTIPARKQIWGI